MTPTTAKFLKGLFTVIVLNIAIGFTAVSAQTTTLKSRVAVVSNETKTSIWVSDFPKQTSIMIYDSNDNLLSMMSTNDFGAAYLSLRKSVKGGVIVKTIDGEVTASNKTVAKNKTEEQNIVSTYQEESNKA